MLEPRRQTKETGGGSHWLRRSTREIAAADWPNGVEDEAPSETRTRDRLSAHGWFCFLGRVRAEPNVSAVWRRVMPAVDSYVTQLTLVRCQLRNLNRLKHLKKQSRMSINCCRGEAQLVAGSR